MFVIDLFYLKVICDCLDAILSSAELLFAPKLESLVVLVLNCFMTTHHSCCLQIVASIMGMLPCYHKLSYRRSLDNNKTAIFGGNKNCEGVFTNLIPQLSDTTLNYLMTKRGKCQSTLPPSHIDIDTPSTHRRTR